MTRYIVTDATWREPGQRHRGWDTLLNQHHANSKAALVDRPPATTFADVFRMTSRPLRCGITKRIRAVVAAVRAYRESMK